VSTTPRRILVTGARGFVGQHLLPALAGAFPGAELIAPHFDLREDLATMRVVRDAAPDACIHLAAISAIQSAANDPDQAWAVNLHGTLRLAACLRKQSPDCQLLFASSADCYGTTFRDRDMLDETAPLAPANLYSATKAAADLALGVLALDGQRVVRLRAFNHTGPGQSERFVVAAFARQIARIEAGLQDPVIQVGNLESRRDFLDVRDVCAAYIACLRRADALPAGAIINLASGTTRRIHDLLYDLLAMSDMQVEVRAESGRMRGVDIPAAGGDNRRAASLLGWTPRIDFARTLADVLADWRHRVTQPASQVRRDH